MMNMLRLVVVTLSLGLVSLSATAQISADNLDWNKATWSCPVSIIVSGVRYRFRAAYMYDGPPEELRSIVPRQEGESKGLWVSQGAVGENIYLVCNYKGLTEALIVHAMGASFCAASAEKPARHACWKKSPNR